MAELRGPSVDSAVSCLPFSGFLIAARAAGLKLDGLTDGLPITLESLADPKARVPWSAACKILERLESAAGGAAGMGAQGRAVNDRSAVADVWRSLGSVVSPLQLYRLSTRWLGPRAFPFTKSTMSHLEGGRFLIRIDIPPEFEGSLPFFHATRGLYESVPRWIGLADSIVEADITSHRGEFTITPPPVASILGRVRRVFELFRSAKSTVDDLVEQQEQLQRSRGELLESEERFRFLVENAKDLIAEWNGKGQCAYVSPNVVDLLGISAAEFRESSTSLLHPEDRQVTQKIMQRAATGGSGEARFRLLHANGRWRWFESTSNVVSLPGQDARVVTVSRDVTEYLRFEQNTRETEQLRLLVENSPLAIYRVDLKGRFLAANPVAVEMIGISAEELRGRLGTELVHPDDIEVVREYASRIDGTGEAPPLVEFRFMRRDGSYEWVRGSGWWVRDADGQVVQMISSVERLGPQRRAEAALRSSELRNRALVAAFPDRVVRVSRDREILDTHTPVEDLDAVTPATRVGSEPAASDLVAEIVEAASETVERVFASGVVESVEFPLQKGERFYEIRVGPCGTDEVLIVARDVTATREAQAQRKEFETRVQEAQKLESLGVLSAGIAHDFNNLLVGMLGNADLALLTLSEDSLARSHVESIDLAATRAKELVNQLLSFSGGTVRSNESVDLNEIVREMGELLESSISKKVELVYRFEEGLPGILADVTQIRQVIMNLITNGSDAIGDASGSITLTTSSRLYEPATLESMYFGGVFSKGGYVCLEVADTGCGINEATRAKMFEPFFTTKFTGRGLGLAAVIGILRTHGAAIDVVSEPGEGTTIRAYFPALGRRAAKADESHVEEQAWRGKGTVLLVDDEELVRSVGQRMLEKSGFSTLVASDGLEAVEIFEKQPDKIVCVVLDLNMPRLGGIETLNRIRAIRDRVPIILSSGYGDQASLSRVTAQPAVAVLEKPYRYSDLKACIRQLLEEADSR